MATASKIQKLTNGTVHFLDSSDNILATLMERARVFRLELQDLIQVVDSSGTTYWVKSTEITDLILDPAPALPFSGTNQDLYRKMTESFFIDVVSDTSDDDLNLSSVSGETVTDALDTLGGAGAGNYLGAFPDENTGGPTFFPIGPYAAGQTYFNTTLNETMEYDFSRSRFLSIDSISVTFGRTSTTSSGATLNGGGGVRFITSTRGYPTITGAVLVSISATRTSVGDADIEVMTDATILGVLPFVGAANENSIATNADAIANSVITIRVGSTSANSIQGAMGVARFKLKSP